MQFSIIAAVDKNRGVGKGGKLPWRLRGDMDHFKTVTSSQNHAGSPNAVIMGRTTWLSLPERFRPLPERLNAVLSHEPLSLPAGVFGFQSLDQAFRELSGQKVGEIFVIGGASVYAQAIKHPACSKIYLTEIDQAFECDTFFPDLPASFRRVSSSEPVAEGGMTYRFVTYQHV